MSLVRIILSVGLLSLSASVSKAALVTGAVVDSKTNRPLPARGYVLDAQGNNHFVRSTTPEGSALPYQEQWVPMARSK